MFSMGGLGTLSCFFISGLNLKESLGAFFRKELHLKSPFQLMSATLTLLLHSFVSKFAADYFGSRDLFDGLSRNADVDAIAVSMVI